MGAIDRRESGWEWGREGTDDEGSFGEKKKILISSFVLVSEKLKKKILPMVWKVCTHTHDYSVYVYYMEMCELLRCNLLSFK